MPFVIMISGLIKIFGLIADLQFYILKINPREHLI